MRRVLQRLAEQCTVRKGSCRIVIDFIQLGFVVKLPIVHFVMLAQSLRAFARRKALIRFSRWVAFPLDNNGFWGLKRLLFKGIADNWREFYFSIRERHPLVQPTYFSLLGLINVQRRGDPLSTEYREFRRQLEQLAGTEQFYSDSHHLASMDNFVQVDGRIRMVDYGSGKTRKVILERGICIWNNFQVRGSK